MNIPPSIAGQHISGRIGTLQASFECNDGNMSFIQRYPVFSKLLPPSSSLDKPGLSVFALMPLDAEVNGRWQLAVSHHSSRGSPANHGLLFSTSSFLVVAPHFSPSLSFQDNPIRSFGHSLPVVSTLLCCLPQILTPDCRCWYVVLSRFDRRLLKFHGYKNVSKRPNAG